MKLKFARIHVAATLGLVLLAALPAAVAPSKPPPATEAPAAPAPAPDDAKPVDAPPPSSPPTEAPKRAGADIGAWFAAWVAASGMPIWAWTALAPVAFLILRGLFRRDRRRDLIGPPPSLRPGARPTAPRPRRPDPPQRL